MRIAPLAREALKKAPSDSICSRQPCSPTIGGVLAFAVALSVAAAPDAPLAERRAALVAQRDQLVAERPPLFPPIIAVGIPLGGLVTVALPVVFLGAISIFADWNPGTEPIRVLGPYAPGMAIAAAAFMVLAAPGVIWLGKRLEAFGVSSNAINEAEAKIEELDAAGSPPGSE